MTERNLARGRRNGRQGLPVLNHAHDLFKHGKVGARGLLLLSEVDWWVNPSWTRYPQGSAGEREDLEFDRERSRPFSYGHLRVKLCCDNRTVNRTIQGLCEIKPRVFWAVRSNARQWDLRTTRWTEDEQTGDLPRDAERSFTIPQRHLDLFEAGDLTGMELMMAAAVYSHSQRGKCPCWAFYRTLGKFIGVEWQHSRNLVERLIGAGLLSRPPGIFTWKKLNAYLGELGLKPAKRDDDGTVGVLEMV